MTRLLRRQTLQFGANDFLLTKIFFLFPVRLFELAPALLKEMIARLLELLENLFPEFLRPVLLLSIAAASSFSSLAVLSQSLLSCNARAFFMISFFNCKFLSRSSSSLLKKEFLPLKMP